MSQESILWYDFETFGSNAKYDSPAQFAALRTDLNLMPISPPEVFYCQPLIDREIAPDAVAITGITPQEAQLRGSNEYQFAQRIAKLMSQPHTTSCGYNSIRFDDEVCRHMFWRNLIDPYGREYKNGNARFDLLDVMRLTSALRPEGLYWPAREDGQPSFKLEQLSVANGIEHANAHDAMADVRATIGLAQKVKQHNEKLWQYVFALRHKYQAKQFLATRQGQPFLHASGKIAARYHGVSALVALATHPSNRNEVICWDLRVDPTPFKHHSGEQLRQWLYGKQAELEEEGVDRPGFKSVHINKAPMLAPISLLDDAVSQRIALDEATIKRHLSALADHGHWQQLAVNVFDQAFQGDPPDPELDLYGGFVSMADRQVLDTLHTLLPERWRSQEDDLSDPRLTVLAQRLRAKHFPHTLSASEQQAWQRHIQRVLTPARLDALMKEVKQRQKYEPQNQAMWQDVQAWYQRQHELVATPQALLF